ncbi:hypothetical protein PCL_02229 [Purpureocillium lilacinum]|uniref:Uncharacterized protein n=1 Tax=Purpureocillium lilacinum TaxID=33203 RepID=A0A2U3E1T5_PURLI|nr:hypothetical protein PCL_02229 [Purpureocillium lilacinum]
MPPWPTSRSPPTKSKVMAWRAGGPMPFRRVESEVVSSLGIHTPRANHRPSNPPNHIPADLHTKSRPVRAPGRTAYIAALAQLSHSLSQVDRSPETSLSVPFPPADRSTRAHNAGSADLGRGRERCKMDGWGMMGMCSAARGEGPIVVATQLRSRADARMQPHRISAAIYYLEHSRASPGCSLLRPWGPDAGSRLVRNAVQPFPIAYAHSPLPA